MGRGGLETAPSWLVWLQQRGDTHSRSRPSLRVRAQHPPHMGQAFLLGWTSLCPLVTEPHPHVQCPKRALRSSRRWDTERKLVGSRRGARPPRMCRFMLCSLPHACSSMPGSQASPGAALNCRPETWWGRGLGCLTLPPHTHSQLTPEQRCCSHLPIRQRCLTETGFCSRDWN